MLMASLNRMARSSCECGILLRASTLQVSGRLKGGGCHMGSHIAVCEKHSTCMAADGGVLLRE